MHRTGARTQNQECNGISWRIIVTTTYYTHIFPLTGGVCYFCISPVFTCIHKITSIQAESVRLRRVPLKDSVTEFLPEGGASHWSVLMSHQQTASWCSFAHYHNWTWTSSTDWSRHHVYTTTWQLISSSFNLFQISKPRLLLKVMLVIFSVTSNTPVRNH